MYWVVIAQNHITEQQNENQIRKLQIIEIDSVINILRNICHNQILDLSRI